jgi:hypothetical protein
MTNHTRNVIFRFSLILLLFLFTAISSFSQEISRDFYSQSLRVNNAGMMVLGSWAVANIGGGAYGWARGSGDTKYFHQMNVFWNVVNLSIAGFALYNNYSLDYSMMNTDELMKRHMNTEKILLINAGLDIGYMGAGLLMRHFSNTSAKRPDLLRGYGNSLLLQGGFLLAFDAILYLVMRSLR